MTPNSVFCIAFSRIQADQMVMRLKHEAFSIHDISVLSAVGPMVNALGDMAGGLLSQGVPMSKVRLYESRIKEGHTLLSVYAPSQHEMTSAMEIFSKAGGTDICTTEEPLQQYSPHTPQSAVLGSETRFRFA